MEDAVPELAIATDEQIEAIYRESFALWGGGLSFDGYLGLLRDLMATPWGREHLEYLVWLGVSGEILSSLKLYRPRVRFLGRTGRAAVIGAVFTPDRLRRRGHAAALIRSALRRTAERDDPVALLFSDIGTRYYEALGFRAIPAEEIWGRLPREPVEVPADWSFVPLQDEHLDDIARAHEAGQARRAIAILRDREHWRFVLNRAEWFFERLDRLDAVHRARVVLRGGRFLGYVVAVDGRGEWHVREVGAVDGDPWTMAEILRIEGSQAARRGLRTVYGWLPSEVLERLEGWRLRRAPRPRAVPMVRPASPHADWTVLASPAASFLPFMDQF